MTTVLKITNTQRDGYSKKAKVEVLNTETGEVVETKYLRPTESTEVSVYDNRSLRSSEVELNEGDEPEAAEGEEAKAADGEQQADPAAETQGEANVA
jgi:hypothetical protein